MKNKEKLKKFEKLVNFLLPIIQCYDDKEFYINIEPFLDKEYMHKALKASINSIIGKGNYTYLIIKSSNDYTYCWVKIVDIYLNNKV